MSKILTDTGNGTNLSNENIKNNIFRNSSAELIDIAAKFPNWDIKPFDEIINPRLKVKQESNSEGNKSSFAELSNKTSLENESKNISQDTVEKIVSLQLVSFGDDKIPIVKLIKNVTGLSISESKAMAEEQSPIILKDLSYDKALDIQKQFLAIGAQTNIL